MKNWTVFAAGVVLAAVGSQASAAIVIDEFNTPGYNVIQTGVGTTNDTRAAAGVLGGSRFVQSAVTAAQGTGQGKVGINTVDLGALTLSSDSQVDAMYTIGYGTAAGTAALNQNFTGDVAFVIRVVAADFTSLANNITIFSSTGSSTASFVVPGGIALANSNSPVDIVVPFASFLGTGSFADVDGITFNFNPPGSADYTIEYFSTAVPEPTAASTLVAGSALLLAGRRRRTA